MKNLAKLQAECADLGLRVETKGRSSKEPYVAALRDYHWRKDHLDQPPPQILPMLLGSWEDLDDSQVEEIELDHHAWIVQPKMDGVRALFHIENDRVRITSRTVSEVTYRLSEFQDNLPHLAGRLSGLNGTILDGELVCPVSRLDTGSTVTGTSLQATMAILAASPKKARQFQDGQQAHIRFHVFDTLRTCGQDVTLRPWIERQESLAEVFRKLNTNFIEPVPSFVVNKVDVHRHIIDTGGEGTVWKRVDSSYEPGRRVGHWIKRKRGIEVEAYVTGFKTGTNGHEATIGALEFGTAQDGAVTPVAWVINWTTNSRLLMTQLDSSGKAQLAPGYLGRRALIAGQDHSAKSGRLRHARIVRWLDV